jgi:hypothetical protein
LIAAATGAEDDWSKALTIGMLALAVICLLGALWAFGGWGAIMGLFRDSPAPVLSRIPSPDNPIGGTLEREPEPATPPVERHLIHRTPQELWELISGLTDMQATKVVEPFIRQWMEISGPVRGVGEWNGGFSQLTIYRGRGLTSRPVFCMFRDETWVPRLATLSSGDRVVVTGEIERIDHVSIQLTNCEIVDPS